MPVLADHVDITTTDWLQSHGVTVLIILVVTFVVSRITAFAIGRVERRIERTGKLDEEGRKRVQTLAKVTSRSIRVAIWIIALLLVVDQLGVNLAPLIAGAGIAGIALGFGAQALVRDFLSGFFILLENQFQVGDNIEISAEGGTVAGVVEDLSLRTTHIRSLDGSLHFIPNGSIQAIGNRTQEWARAVLDVEVAYGEDLDRVQETLEEVLRDAVDDDALGPLIVDQPEVLGVEVLGASGVSIRVVAKVKPPNQWNVQRELRKRIKRRFDERGIEIPFPQRVVWTRSAREGSDPG